MTSTLIPEFRYRIEHDEYAENPRTTGAAVTNVITFLRRNYLPIDDDFGPLSAAWMRLAYRYSSPLAVRIFERYARAIHGAVTLVDRPSDGAFAIWYVMPDDVDFWTGAKRGNPEQMESGGLQLLRDERDEYRSWANNEAVRFVIEKRTTWTNPDHEDRDSWEEVEAVGGFFDEGEAEAEARAALSRREEDARWEASSDTPTPPENLKDESGHGDEDEDEVPDVVWDAVVAGPASLERVVAATEGENPAWDVGSVINEAVRVAVRTVREFDAAQGREPDPR
ncbi:hypothetical protein [Lentzea sp. NEAU-D7]|uniref:hypothetical protein n=1 Tax=Lentzea sp. NEAU-D7 TaxID=2994667 RepID=UPI00224B21C3|nr:hypothetical protein [Lentzea sp. NEAU-D7]MCX2949918.1 hypothetical protein [Lentzea sp. NEAU-D7]